MTAIKKAKLYCDYSTERLFDTIRAGNDVATIQAMFQVGVDVNARDPEGHTPLLLACLQDRVKIVDLLIKVGANVGVKYGRDWTVLHYPSAVGSIEMVRTLVNRVPDLDARDINGETALHHASRSGCLEVVQCLLEGGADIDMKSYEDFTPLLCAAQISWLDAVDLLLSSRANVEVCEGMLLYYAARSGWTKLVHSLVKILPNLNECVFGETFLHAASTYGHLEIVKCLLEGGADINKRNDGGPQNGETALHPASRNGHLEIVKCFLEKGADINVKNYNSARSVLLAAQSSHADVVDLLLHSGANVDGLKEMLFYYATRNGWTKLVHYLVKILPNLNECIFGETFLYIASTGGHLEIVKCLLEGGIDINKRNYGGPEYGGTALHPASRNGHLEIVKCLVGKGADINVKNYKGDTPVLLAAESSYKDVVDLLIHCGANVNATNSLKYTLLHFASVYGWLDVVQCIVEQTFDLDVKSCSRLTALNCACFKKQFDIAQYLIQEGASWDIEDKNGISPLSCAIIERPDFKITKLFIENGAYLKSVHYEAIVKSSLLKVLLQDVELCCQAIINKFNHDLTELYELPVSQSLPCIEIITIASGSEVAQAIKQTVTFEIETKGHCNILEVRPMALSIFSVRSVLEYYQKTK